MLEVVASVVRRVLEARVCVDGNRLEIEYPYGYRETVVVDGSTAVITLCSDENRCRTRTVSVDRLLEAVRKLSELGE